MASIPELILLWHQKQISGLVLMRGLVSFDEWQVRVTEAATAKALAENTLPTLTISKDPEGKLCLLAFSSNEAYGTFAKATGATGEQHFLTIRGTDLFSGPLAEIERIQIDPLSPYDIFYDQNLFERLRETARAVTVEETLRALRRGEGGDGGFQAVREYKNYYIAATVRDGKPQLMMAPDDKGRRLAAAFTADDTFDAFLPEANQMAGDAKVEQMQIDGLALFDLIQRMQLDGFVFNCSGPVKPVAFAHAAAGVFLGN